MLRTNLSTRPFYNERAVHTGLLIAALVVVALTALNVVRIVTLSRQNTGLSTQIEQEQAEAARLRREAASIRAGIDQASLTRIVAAATEANALIDQRTFSWTEFFNRIEATLPADVMLTAVRPSFDQGRIVITMDTVGRRAEDIDEFIERLEATGAFANALPARENVTDQGMYQVAITALYSSGEAQAAPAAAPEAAPAPDGSRKAAGAGEERER
jgi:hypothetical protein